MSSVASRVTRFESRTGGTEDSGLEWAAGVVSGPTQYQYVLNTVNGPLLQVKGGVEVYSPYKCLRKSDRKS